MTGIRTAGVVLAVLLVGGIGWNAGEIHRKNCIHEGHIGCSVLPWDSGREPPASTATPSADCILYSENCP